MSDRVRRLPVVGAAVAIAAGLVGCGAAEPAPGTPSSTVAAAARSSAAPVPTTPARVGTPAASQVQTFEPAAVTLPSGDTVRVLAVGTQDGALQMPVSGGVAGWWDGSSSIGDPFGATVIAGHVDTRAGAAPFGQLLRAKVGDLVTVTGRATPGRPAPRMVFRVSTVGEVVKNRIATASSALAQTGPARLSLITCTGVWDPVARHYESNLVVTALPTTRSPS